MIPLKLSIKNFLSYGPKTQIIDFANHHLICLSGRNGHGKSALLDAITWVLWGQARKTSSTSKADAGLVHLGQTDMMVSLDVRIDEQIYRIRRECTQYTKRSKIALDIGIVDTKTDLVKPLSENHVRCTQEHINKLIGLDYHTFVNSVFLRQGHANEFSKKTAKERKKILATILGLDHYDKLQKKSLEQNRQLQQKHAMLEKVIELLQPDVDMAANITQEIKEQKKIHEQILKEENILAHEQSKLNQEKNRLIEQKQYSTHIEQKYKETQQTITEKSKTLNTTWREWRTVQRNYAQQNKKMGTQKKEEITQAIALQEREKTRQNRLHDALLKIKEELYRTHKAIEETHTKNIQKNIQQKYALESSIKTLSETIEQKTKELQILSKQEHALVTTKKPLLEKRKQKEEIAQLDQKLTRYKQYLQKSSTDQATRTMRIRAITYDVNRICSTSNAACPVCEQGLSAQKQELLVSDYNNKKSLALHQLKRLKKIHTRIESLVERLEKEKTIQHDITQNIQRLEEKNAHIKTEIKHKSDTKQAMLKKLQQAHTELLTCMQAQEKYEKQKLVLFEQNKSYQNLKKLLAQKETERAACTYNQEIYTQLQKKLSTLVEQEKKDQDFIQAYALQGERKRSIQQLCAQLRELKHKTKKYLAIVSQKTIYEKSYSAHEQKEKLVTEKQQKLMQNKLSLVQKQGALEQQKIRCDKALKEYAQHKAEQKELEQEINCMTTLAHALSKDGIQALVIENAIPEIEQEANALLSRLTRNQTHIIIDSTRDLKSGGTRETLDIKISDPAGIRPYEMFSGGEAFRIDFALRIALSKLLARRAGTTLQTLIIDEGFSSQDEDGLNHIVSTLNAIQQDFAKIIIVSHLPQLKEQFPVHFYVHKNINGSTVRLLAN